MRSKQCQARGGHILLLPPPLSIHCRSLSLSLPWFLSDHPPSRPPSFIPAPLPSLPYIFLLESPPPGDRRILWHTRRALGLGGREGGRAGASCCWDGKR